MSKARSKRESIIGIHIYFFRDVVEFIEKSSRLDRIAGTGVSSAKSTRTEYPERLSCWENSERSLRLFIGENGLLNILFERVEFRLAVSSWSRFK